MSFNEFVAATLDPNTPDLEEHWQMAMRSTFHRFAGKSGTISFPNLVEMFPSDMSKTLVQSLFSEMDTDRDGQITFEEFKTFLAEL